MSALTADRGLVDFECLFLGLDFLRMVTALCSDVQAFRPKWIILQPRAEYKAKHARFRYWRIAPSAPW
jgi:hypothetical protein